LTNILALGLKEVTEDIANLKKLFLIGHFAMTLDV
jgi:hypothetical protein